ncbi:Asparagine synthetase (glutamine-hydrolyzing) 2 [Lasiodiplodia theobromae]|uniref:Asparagine synthetase (Glutamine-hydrolyzing) 2 n=1 Tax=Lasiodiplodia theobromae TaxID=45133 RepID=A0A5N5CZX5_9PEZI|nr:Asparagine synthetase (glutamine-hydrolyzing) 2 [Lasiodiplodia theobromae]
MCGISCIVHQGDPSDINRDELSQELYASLEAIKHRGPDSRGQWISPDNRVGSYFSLRSNIIISHLGIESIQNLPRMLTFFYPAALGHVRLAINDLAPTGAQPFSSPDSTVHAVVNGELYDYDALRASVLQHSPDYAFAGHSDCELVVALYLQHGLSFLSRLRGEFSLCLYDARTQMFVAARDRYGIKPLFWRVDGERRRIEIAAEAKAWLPFGWAPEWDVKSLLEAGWNHDQRTLFTGVRKVRPGHYLTCQGFEDVQERMYWDVEYPDKRTADPRSEQEMIEGVRERLLEAVRIRLRADVPVGIYLSGGIDSSVVAGMVTHLVKERGEKIGNEKETDRVSCFGIAFDEDSGYDESSIANRTADFLGVKFHKKHMGEAELAAYFEDATYHCEHHNADLNYVGKFALSEVPREVGFKAVLTGEGSDENFAGYPTYLPDYLREPDLAWPANALSDRERDGLREETEELTERNYRTIGMDSAKTGDSVAVRMLNGIKTPQYMTAWGFDVYEPWAHEVYGTCDPRLTVANNVDGRTRELIMNKWHPLHSAMYVWSKGHLANSFLSCLGDRTEMAHSLEARTPFLDHHLTEYVNGLPPSVKVRWDAEEQRFIEKWILREASKPFITSELYQRKKHVSGLTVH